MTSSQSSPAAPTASRARAWRAANSSAGKSCLDMLLPPHPALSPWGRGMREVSISEAGDDLLSDDLDGAHDLVVRRVADLEHEDHLVDARGRPALHLAAHAVGVAPDGHPLVEEVVIRIPRHAGLDPGHALGGPEPHMVQLGVVVAIVEARGGAAQVAAGPDVSVPDAD